MDALVLKINLDCLRKDSQAIINAKVGEANGRKVVFTLYEGRTAFFVPAEATAILRAQKPDGTILYNHCVIDDGKVEYTITSQTVAVAGVYACELQISSGGRIIYSPYVTLNVMANLYSDAEVESSNEFTELDEALKKLPSLDVINAKYTKPAGGIPKADLSEDVRASLAKADTALQEHQSLAAYRTAAGQDAIDATKQDKLTAGENITISADGKTISATGGDGGLGVFEVTLTSADGVLAADKTFEQVKAAVADGKPVLKVHSDGDVLWFFLLDKSPAEIDFVGFVDEQILAYLTAKQDGSWETIVTARVTVEMLSELSDKLGNLNNLTTTEKTSLVAAINELKSAAASFAPVATSGSYNDLADKPTIPSVPTATIQANAAARHEHSNKTVLDLISETVKTAWDAASTWVTTNGANVLSHLSDSIKHITAAERTAWNGKQDKIIAGDNITIAADGKTISATGGGGGVSGDIETVEAQQIEIPSKLSDFENDSGFVTSSAVEAALADKQDTISDLDTIRSGAGKGATALQAVPTTYRTAFAQDVIDNGLSDRVGAIEEKEAGWNGKYSKPTGGIPKADLASAVQAALDKADSALQAVPSTYRTASAQDSIDSGKVDKVTGKGLSTNDYTAADKAKVAALAPVATSGSYNDLTDKPTISGAATPLTGTTSEVTPSQVSQAIFAGTPVVVNYTDGTYGALAFTNFNIAENFDIIAAQTIVKNNETYIFAELGGNISTNNWFFNTALLATVDIVPEYTSQLTNDSGFLTGHQDISGKVDKVAGKGLSTNDYTNAAKAKVDAIPASPKYTDTVYDDTAVKSRLSAVEGKLNGSGSASFASVETAALKATGEVEVYGAQPHIDLHFNNSTSDYTSRIIETENGKINIAAPNGVSANGTPLAAESITLTANTSRITNASYTAKYLPLLGAVFVRIYGKINADLNTGYDYDLFSIGSRLPNSIAALSVKCGKDAMANAKTASGSGAIQIRPLESGINGYDVYITGFWFV